ncbi:hypothetical protein, partial [Pseudogemmobacter humi]|uniref:hypothetical protein n=1 Tax=Pseudogemmobacter humi TaxID=2483812 RepID=UPI00135C3140
ARCSPDNIVLRSGIALPAPELSCRQKRQLFLFCKTKTGKQPELDGNIGRACGSDRAKDALIVGNAVLGVVA